MRDDRITLGQFLFVLAIFLVPLSYIQTAGCAANQARERVLMPAIDLATESVVRDIDRGLETLDEDAPAGVRDARDTLLAAVADDDRARIVADVLPRWPSLRAAALAGIAARENAGDIGAVLAEQRRLQVRTYGEALMKLKETTR